MRILKYILLFDKTVNCENGFYVVASVELPNLCNILSCQMQNRDVVIWVEVPDTTLDIHFDNFYIFPTGVQTPILEELEYLTTLQNDNLVWHVYKE